MICSSYKNTRKQKTNRINEAETFSRENNFMQFARFPNYMGTMYTH